MYLLYRTLTFALSPFMPLLLRLRLARGKEDAARLPERLGRASLPRPSGKLLWIHAASVGEANSAFALVEALLEEHSSLHILLTTVTATSAALMAEQLAALHGRAWHQFAPVDTPHAVQRFLKYWRPEVALWVDSELWPNLILQTHQCGALMGIVNARLSERSYRRWKKLPGFIARMLAPFTFCFAQSAADGERLKDLGMRSVTGICNLKYDAPVLSCDAAESAWLKTQIGARPVWLAASTHPGEEELVLEVHLMLSAAAPDLLTIIVPRHAQRGDAVASALGTLPVARRSRGEPITSETQCYLADTMGELGLFYRLAPVAFIGGSLVPHGGQNPLEGAKLGCALIVGPYMRNFAAVLSAMLEAQALVQVQDATALAFAVKTLLENSLQRSAQAENALTHVRAGQGALGLITQQLRAALS